MASREPRPLVHWIGPNTAPILRRTDNLAPYAAVGTTFRALHQTEKGITEGLRLGSDLLIDTEGWRNQADEDHPLRPEPELQWREGKFDPDAEVLSERAIDEIAERNVDTQIGAGGTWLASASHLFSEHVPLSVARRNDLALAHEHVEVVSSRGPTAPRDLELPRERKAIVTVTIKLATISAVTVREVIDAYAEMNPAAFILRVIQFGGSRDQYIQARRIALELQERTGSAVLIEGMGHFSYGMLRNGVAGAILGHGRTTIDPVRNMLEALERSKRGRDEEKDKRGVPTYAPTILGSVRVGRTHDALRRLLLQETNCACGAHGPDQLLRSQGDAHWHNYFWEGRELRQAISADPRRVKEEFGGRVRAAQARRKLARMPKLMPAWRAALVPYAGSVDPRRRRWGLSP